MTFITAIEPLLIEPETPASKKALRKPLDRREAPSITKEEVLRQMRWISGLIGKVIRDCTKEEKLFKDSSLTRIKTRELSSMAEIQLTLEQATNDLASAKIEEIRARIVDIVKMMNVPEQKTRKQFVNPDPRLYYHMLLQSVLDRPFVER